MMFFLDCTEWPLQDFLRASGIAEPVNPHRTSRLAPGRNIGRVCSQNLHSDDAVKCMLLEPNRQEES